MSDEHVRRDSHRGLVRVGDTLVPEGVTVYTGAGDGPSDPSVTATFEVRNGRPECVNLAITAKPDGRGIRLRDLELFTLDAATDAAFASFALPAHDASPTDDDVERFRSRRGTAPEEEQQAARRDVHRARAARPPSRDELERVAQVYRDYIDHKPVDTVQKVLGYGSERTAARRIKQAEQAGLLPPTTPGKKRKV